MTSPVKNVKDLQKIVLNVLKTENTLQIVPVLTENSVMMKMVNMNAKTVLTNVKPVLKNLPLVKFVKLKELMLQIVLVHQVSMIFQKNLNVLDVLKDVKLVTLVVLVSLVTTIE